MSTIITEKALRDMVSGWLARGKRVAGPEQVRGTSAQYRWLSRAEDLLLDAHHRPTNSIKEFIFPRHEKLYGYKLDGRKIELIEATLPEAEQIIVAARPCDAAALPVLDHVFNWDYRDAFYNRRRNLTTVVTLACQDHDAHCFCTAIGSGPDDERGSDVLLFDLGDGAYEVRCLTEKGRDLFAGKLEPSTRTGQAGPGPERRLDMEAIREFLNQDFESPAWAALTLRCIGCGACAYNCPTCHCFDIVDEKSGGTGARVRNWDSCQFSLFTAHASGHNPRIVQGQRQRQRIYHKFEVYPAKFGETLCTGCGNCSRICPVGLGVLPVLAALEGVEETEPSESETV